jgi:hypothetical protein
MDRYSIWEAAASPRSSPNPPDVMANPGDKHRRRAAQARRPRHFIGNDVGDPQNDDDSDGQPKRCGDTTKAMWRPTAAVAGTHRQQKMTTGPIGSGMRREG